MNVFSSRLRDLRVKRSEQQADMAKILGVSPQSYSAYENGREPNYDTLFKLAKYFGVTTDYLLGLSEYKNAEKKQELDEFVNLIDNALSLLDGDYLDMTKECFKSYLKILNRQDVSANMASRSAHAVRIFVDSLNAIMDEMCRAENISTYDSIDDQKYENIKSCFYSIYTKQSRIENDIARTFEIIVDRPSVKIKKTLKNAKYDVSFMPEDEYEAFGDPSKKF